MRRDQTSELDRLRLPPHSTEAEQSVLGGLLIDPAAFDHAGELLTDSDFYRHEHRLIFGAIRSLIQAGKPADVVYLNDLAQSVPSAANMRRYAEIVRERSMLRKLIAASDAIATAALNHEGRDVGRIIDDAEAVVLAVGETGARSSTSASIQSLAVQLIDRVQAAAENPDARTGVRTGFHDFDRMTGGLQKGDLIVLAARPSMGKTALALNIAEAVCAREELPVLVFSMEMGAAQLAERLASSLSRIPAQRLKAGTLDEGEWGRFADAAERMQRLRMEIDEIAGLSVAELRARARRIARQFGGALGLIVVDYLQLMSGSGASDENRATELGEISRGLKALAKELQCPLIALSQLNRSVETRTDKRPLMSDLRDSGAIEQDADVIAMLYRDEYYTKEASKEPGVAELILAKQRNGPTGTVKLAFIKPLTKFENLAPT